MTTTRARSLYPAVDVARDHVLGAAGAEITLVEYGSYACPYCHAAHEVVANLRDRFGDRMKYVFRHLPIRGDEGVRAASVAEYAAQTTGRFWEAHDALMQRGPDFERGELEGIAAELGLPPLDAEHEDAWRAAATRVEEDAASARRSGAAVTPTFFINGRRYEGAWDESALAEAMLGSLGHRIHAATLDFARWAPSTGLLLLVMTLIAVVVSNTALGPAVDAFWRTPFGFVAGGGAFTLPLVDWVDHGLLSIFFLVVGLEIKREFTIGRLASRRAAALPVAASLGGMLAPALLYLLVIPSGPLSLGWGTTIATDTAFAIALVVLLGDRVPVDLRVFLTAAVIVDDLVAIVVVAVFYSGELEGTYLAGACGITAALVALNRWGVYRALPYAVLGVVLWACLHGAGLHATLAGVILAVVTPTRPPANLRALMAQAQTVIEAETRDRSDAVMRHGPSEPALRALDAIHDRIESPASKLLRTIEPWSSYVVLPVFALANAGVVWSAALVEGHGRLILAVALGLALGKPLGIVSVSWLVVRLGLAEKPAAYSWRQLAGAGAVAGIGFTMSLFIAARSFASPEEFGAAKLAIFAASLLAGALGAGILWPRRVPDASSAALVEAH
jgi:NhaA family Na+:H+ antiporter